MLVKLKRDNYYLSETEGQKFGKKGEVVNIDPLFYKHIKGFCEIAKENKPEQPQEKALDKMNKAELIEKAKNVGLEFSDDEYEALNKADIIKLIQEKQQ